MFTTDRNGEGENLMGFVFAVATRVQTFLQRRVNYPFPPPELLEDVVRLRLIRVRRSVDILFLKNGETSEK